MQTTLTGLNPLTNLSRFGEKKYSQFHEDGITLELVRRFNPNPVFIEIGAGHNGENNTHVLLDHGWSGLWVEGKPDHYESLKASTASYSDEMRSRLVIRNTFVETGNLREAVFGFRRAGLLSIDVDGNDYWIWKSLCSLVGGVSPAIVIVECNVQKPFDEPYIMPYDPTYIWDHGSYETGASVHSMIELGRELGYRFMGMASETPALDSPNAFFVREDAIEE